jgi:tRNA nucleotidyltransferase (CCA-adding enzyme)
MEGEAYDWDITTQAISEKIFQIFKEFKVILMGRKFGTVTVVINYVNYKVSTFEGNNRE